MFTNVRACFDRSEVNTGRQDEMDLAKGFAILFMVLAHCVGAFNGGRSELLEVLGNDVLGGPFSAPVFMFCMGVGICYTNSNSPDALLRRGWKLLGYGLLLNVFRYFLPALLGLAMSGGISWKDLLTQMLSVDILQFAGLYFIFFACFKKLSGGPLLLALLTAACALLGGMLRGVSTGSEAGNVLSGFLWGSYEESYFPFLNWMIFPSAGYLFALLWKHCADIKKYYRVVWPACLVLLLAYLFLTVTKGMLWLSDGEYFWMGAADALVFLVLIQFIFVLCYGLIALLPSVKSSILMTMSRNINSIYCIHWTILCFLSEILAQKYGLTQLAPLYILLLTGGLTILSDLLAKKWKAFRAAGKAHAAGMN